MYAYKNLFSNIIWASEIPEDTVVIWMLAKLNFELCTYNITQNWIYYEVMF